MIPSFDERQELAKQFRDQVARMLSCLQAAGKHVVEDDIVYAWTDYSDGLCAGWLTLPDDDDTLLAILLKHLPASGLMWHTTIHDAGDGSGDYVLPLPEEMLVHLGWQEGGTLSITKAEPGILVMACKE